VFGATAGQYIIPVNDNGAIKGQAISNPTFEQYQQVIGTVIAIEADGRAKIIVKIASGVESVPSTIQSAAGYATLSEIYEADADYSPGTVVSFGGNKEVTLTQISGDTRVAGIISERPSYLMNTGLTADHRAIVALMGRISTRVIGAVGKGDMMVSAGNGCARASASPAMGTVIGKALENFDGESGVIEIVVGRI